MEEPMRRFVYVPRLLGSLIVAPRDSRVHREAKRLVRILSVLYSTYLLCKILAQRMKSKYLQCCLVRGG